MKTNLKIVNIYIKSPTFDFLLGDVKTNFVTKMSLLGGTFGLFAGVSVLSGVEALYFFALILWTNLQKYKKHK